jgi:hypothetical protein
MLARYQVASGNESTTVSGVRRNRTQAVRRCRYCEIHDFTH